MFSEKIRNTIVGLTTLAAIGLLMYGIFALGKAPSLGGRRSYNLTLTAANANGCTQGAKVDLNGVIVGQVSYVSPGTDPKTELFQAKIVLSIDGNADIPSNAKASLGKVAGLGTPYVSLLVTGPADSPLPRNNSKSLTATVGDGGSLIPQQVTDQITSVANDLAAAAKDIHTLLAYPTPEEIQAAASQPASATQPRENVATLVIHLNHTMKSVDALLTNPQLQDQIRNIVKNLSDASDQLKTTLANIDTTAKNADKAFGSFGDVAGKAAKTLDTTQAEILRISEKLVEMLGEIQKTTRQLAEGNGTTGKLINDPHLYDSLVDLSKSLRSTVTDLDFLLKKWQDQGVDFHIK